MSVMDVTNETAAEPDRFLLNTWASIYQTFGEDDLITFFFGTIIVTSAAFYGTNGFFMILDLAKMPKFLYKYKIQSDKQVEMRKLRKALRQAAINQILVSLPAFVAWYYIAKWRGCSCGYDVPSGWEIVRDLVVILAVEEIGFYYTHRMWHHPIFYQKIHKLHHEWTAPIGIVAVYLHPLEYFVSGVMVALAGPIIMGSHMLTSWIWLFAGVIATTVHHSGYSFPGPLRHTTEFHDFHHLKYNYCYGVFGILDYIHGTDTLYRKSTKDKRKSL
ncbi:fatty acid hydroxylase domain-containing protein 2-like [Ptychodera flava]|uniref:fatty acid hydroxylase domain-containing protein 2-like n=1 Tax=Ptychodera flava TaxID=63121 RepID=UPI003969E6A4